MEFDPSDADELVNISSIVQKIPLPGTGQDDSTLTCFTDDDGNNKCFMSNGFNQVSCKDDTCFVNFKTMNQKVLGNRDKIDKLDLDVLINPSGVSTTIQLVGSIPKKRLRTLKKIIGDVKVDDVDDLPSITIGMPRPPPKCHLNPLGAECSRYLSSDDYTFIPLIGFKKRTDIMIDPKTVFKSEVIPQVKKAIGMFMDIIRSRNGNKRVKKVDAENPMHVNRVKKVETEKKSQSRS